jgi:hypothetical protein
MKTISRVIGSAGALSILMLSPVSVLGRTDHQHEFTHCILRGEPVLDAPFSAEAITVWHPPPSSGRGEMRAIAHYYRDRAGRVRIEQRYVGDAHPQRIIVWPDTNSQEAYLVDPVARTSHSVPRGLAQMMVGGGCGDHYELLLPTERYAGFFQVRDINIASGGASEEPERQTIAGIETTGTRFATSLPEGLPVSGRGERWVSQELKLVVRSRSEDTEIGIVEYQLSKISRTDPRADLFEVPSDYETAPVKYPLSWHSLKTELTTQGRQRR